MLFLLLFLLLWGSVCVRVVVHSHAQLLFLTLSLPACPVPCPPAPPPTTLNHTRQPRRRTGSLFWPDLWYNAWVNDTIYSLVGDMQRAPWVDNKHHRLVDSGQMLFDRERHAEVRR